MDPGSAYVYDLASDTPTLPMMTLANPSPATNDNFGWSVAISGTRIVVGAFRDNTGAVGAGSAYVYDLLGTTPALPIATLINPSPAVNDWFGLSVSISGTRVVVGAPYDDTEAANAGSAYVYDLASPIPAVPSVRLTKVIPASSDGFGYAVASPAHASWLVRLMATQAHLRRVGS